LKKETDRFPKFTGPSRAFGPANSLFWIDSIDGEFPPITFSRMKSASSSLSSVMNFGARSDW